MMAETALKIPSFKIMGDALKPILHILKKARLRDSVSWSGSV